MSNTKEGLSTNDSAGPVPVSSASSLDTFALSSVGLAGGEQNSSTNAQRNTGLASDQTPATVPLLPRQTVTQPSQQSAPVSVQQHQQHIDGMQLQQGIRNPSESSAIQPSIMSGNMLFSGTSSTAGNSVPEFLFQLTKMLTDDNNDIIEWSNGLIKVHSPIKLESHVLHKYFRHSKFSSFQRQLNYFGFRKLAGKGKMAPCSYANESAGEDISSLLFIKRKTSTSTSSRDKGSKKKAISSKKPEAPSQIPSAVQQVNPVLAGILHQTAQSAPRMSSSQQALARSAVGKGIRHSFMAPNLPSRSQPTSSFVPSEAGSNAVQQDADQQQPHDNLSQLATNFQNSMNDLQSAGDVTDKFPLSGNLLGSNSSLVDLAMIPSAGETLEESTSHPTASNANNWNFVDFPFPEIFPASTSSSNDQGNGEQQNS